MATDSESQFLTTGRAAKLLGVTSDTVLRWVKQGRLTAKQTSGGHNRIPLEAIEPLVHDRGITVAPTRASACVFEPLRCWEYLNPCGDIRDGCKRCIVYRARATWCFRLAETPDDVGHSKLFCNTTCEECVYYRKVHRLVPKVLVVTSDQSLQDRLEQAPRNCLSLRFAHSAYAASLVIGSFLPGFVVVDCSLEAVDITDLVESLASDPRVPGLRIILAVRHGLRRPSVVGRNKDVLVGVIEKPFGARCIEALIDCLPVESMSRSHEGEKRPRGAVGVASA